MESQELTNYYLFTLITVHCILLKLKTALFVLPYSLFFSVSKS